MCSGAIHWLDCPYRLSCRGHSQPALACSKGCHLHGGAVPVPVPTGSRKHLPSSPAYPCPGRQGEEHVASSRGVWRHCCRTAHTLMTAQHSSAHISPVTQSSPGTHSSSHQFCWQQHMPVRHTCAHSHAHTRTQLAFSNMPDIAFLMLAQEIPVAAWSASFVIRGAGGQAPVPARGGWRGQTHRSWPLRLLSSPIICHFRPLLMSYLGCIFFVIAKQWQKPG